jgi:hypothetical protein
MGHAFSAHAEEPVSFKNQIAPILVERCSACHAASEPKGGYQVGTFALLQKPGDSESPPIVAGKVDESWLVELISSDDPDSRMPKDADPLLPEQIGLVKRWIAEGAKFDGPDPSAALAAYAARPPHPDPPAQYRRPLPITALAFTPDGSQIAVGGYHEITIWSVADGALLRRIKGAPQRVMGLAYNADGSLLAVVGGTPGVSGEVKAFDTGAGVPVKDFAAMADVAFRAVFSPDGKKLAACGADRTIRIFDVASGAQDRIIEDHADWVIGLAWSPDGAQLASASRDKTAKLFNAVTGDSVTTFPGHNEQVFGVAVSSDGKRVISAGADKKLLAWKSEDGQKAAEAGGFGREVLALIGQGDKLISACADGKVYQHRGDGLALHKAYEGLTDEVFSVAYHEATQRVAGGSFSGDVRIWNAEDGQTVLNFIAAPGYAPTK